MITGEAAVVCFPTTTAEVAAAVRVCRDHGRPFVPRGSGHRSGRRRHPGRRGAARRDRDHQDEPDPRGRSPTSGWPGSSPACSNLDLSRAVAHLGLHFAPDPSSQQSCSIGGNLANNSGGPHCLLYGVTSAHILAIEVVLPDGAVALLGGLDPEPDGLDLRGAFVGSEGTMGIATRIAVRLTPLPPAVATLLADFSDHG